MNSKNRKLIDDLRELVKAERKLTREILSKIALVDELKLYAELGYPSLMAWLIEDLRYTKSSAYRRMQAARLLQSAPKAQEFVESGEANVTTLAILQTAIRQEETRQKKPIAIERKEILVSQLKDKSCDETERMVHREFPDLSPRPAESLRVASETESKLTVVLSEKQVELLKRVKEVTSHSHFNASWAELIEVMAISLLKQRDPLLKKSRAYKSLSSAAEPILKNLSEENSGILTHSGHDQVIFSAPQSSVHAKLVFSPVHGEKSEDLKSDLVLEIEKSDPQIPLSPTRMSARKTHSWTINLRAKEIGRKEPKPRANTEPLPQALKNKIIRRDQGACGYQDPVTGKICASRLSIEVDHRIPRRLGGSNVESNLRCLCRTHNQLMARKVFM